VAFDPDRDLVGYSESRMSDWADLFRFEPFDGRSGEPLGPEELAELRRQWQAEQARVAAEVARLEADPAARRLLKIERGLRRHPYFSKVELIPVRTHPPLILLVQRPQKAERDHVERVAASYAPWLREMMIIFQHEYARPLELAPREEPLLMPWAVLASEGDWSNFLENTGDLEMDWQSAHYDTARHLGVTFEQRFAKKIPPAKKRRGELAVFARALLEAHRTAASSLPVPLWIRTGLAEYLTSYEPTSDPRGIAERVVDADALGAMGFALARAELRETCLLPLEELLAARDFAAVFELAAARARSGQHPVPKGDPIWGLWYAQTCLWMRYLHDEADGMHREAIGRCIERSLKGQPAPAAFSSAFEGVDRPALERDFWAWVAEQVRSSAPNLFLVDGWVPATIEQPAAPVRPEPGPDAAEAPVAAALGLALSPDEVEARFALGLELARRGRLARAAVLLDELGASPAAGALAERLGRERARVGRFLELRREFLEHLREAERSLDLTWEGARLRARVESVEEDAVLLGENRRGVASLPLDEIDPLELSERMGDRRIDFDAGWMALWPCALVGDDRARRLAREEDPEAEALLADMRDDYPERLRVGAAAFELEALESSGLPAGAAQARATWDRVRQLARSGSELDLVQGRLPALRQLARHALAPLGEELELSELLHGELERLAGGRLRLTYDFDDADQALDFVPEPYAEDRRKPLPPIAVLEDSPFSVIGGRLVAGGAACSRHVLGFETPLVVRYQLTVLKDGVEEHRHFLFLMAACDDGREAFSGMWNFGALETWDELAPRTRNEGQPTAYFFDTSYDMELRCDGRTLQAWRDGELADEMPAGSGKAGGLFLWMHGDRRMAVDRVEIEARPQESALLRLRETWIEGRMSEAGLL